MAKKDKNIRSGATPKSYVKVKDRNERWRKEWIDYCELIGREQTAYKRGIYSQVYRQIMGDTKIGVEQMGGLNKIAKSLSQDTKMTFSQELADKEIKHFDFIGNIVEKVTQQFLELDDAITIDSIDKESKSEFMDYMSEVLFKDIDANMQAHINKILIMKGLNPNIDETAENAEELKQALLAEIDAIQKDHSLSTVPNRAKRDYRDIMVEFSNKTILDDKQRFRFDEMDRESILDFMVSGSWLRVPRIGLDYYTVENWRQFDSFWITGANETDPQKALIIGRNRWLFPHEIIEQYGVHLTVDEKEAIISNDNALVSGKYRATYGLNDSLATLGMGMLVVGDEAQLARASNTLHKVDISDKDTLLSMALNSSKDDIFGYGTSGKIEVTEAFYKTYKKVGFIKFEYDGETINQIVSEEIVNEFLDIYEIKELKKVTKEQFLKSDEPNIIYWDFEEEVRWGGKINNYGVGADDKNNKTNVEIYMGSEDAITPTILSDSQFVNKKNPVCGVINKKSRIKEISDYQALHNLCMNEMMDYIEKDMGIVTFYNFALLGGLLDGDDPKDSLNTAWSLIKEYGMIPYSQRTELQGQAAPPPMSVFNASMHEIIRHKYEMAQVFKQQAMNILEIAPAQPMVQKQNEIEQNTATSTTVTEVIYDEFREGKIRLYDTQIEVAKYAKSNKIDNTDYVSSSMELNAYIDSSPELIANRKAKVYPQNNPKDRRQLKELQQMIYMNTIEGSFEERGLLKTANNVTSFLERSKEMARKAEQIRALQQEHEQKLMQDQVMAEKEKEQQIHENKKELEMIKAYVALKKQSMLSAGFQDTQAEQDNMLAEADYSFRELEQQFDATIMKKKAQIAELDKREGDKFKERQLELQEREVAAKEKKVDNELTIATTNKNKYDFPKTPKANNTKKK